MQFIHRIRRAALRLVSFANPALFPVNLYKLWHLWQRSDSQTILRLAIGSSNNYAKWVRQYDTMSSRQRDIMRKRYADLPTTPVITLIITLDNDLLCQLEKTLLSLAQQVYQQWTIEIIVEDVGRQEEIREVLVSCLGQDWQTRSKIITKPSLLERTGGSIPKVSVGDETGWIAHIRAGDSMPEPALLWVAAAVNADPEAKLIYSDEDRKDAGGVRYAPFFKGNLDILLILAQNMVGQLCVYQKDLINELGGFPAGNHPMCHWDLVLQTLSHIDKEQVIHIPKILYHRQDRTGGSSREGRKCDQTGFSVQEMVAAYLKRAGIMAKVVATPENAALNRVCFSPPEPAPLVSIIIPTYDNATILEACLSSILNKTSYPSYEIIVIDNGSEEQNTFELFDRMKKEGVRVIRDTAPFNFSALNNKGVQHAKGALICLMNNDIEVITEGWLYELVSFAAQPDIGCVGARLWYPDGRLQHAGIICGIGQVAGHPHRFLDRTQQGYFGRAVLHQEVSAVTAACLVVRRSVYEGVGGLDEALAVSYNDVDFCLRVQEAGYRNVWTPYAELFHHESISRGYENTIEKQERIFSELDFMQNRWGEKLMNDSHYNPNLTLHSEDYSLAWPPRQ